MIQLEAKCSECGADLTRHLEVQVTAGIYSRVIITVKPCQLCQLEAAKKVLAELQASTKEV